MAVFVVAAVARETIESSRTYETAFTISQLSTSRANILERAFSDIDVASVSEHQSMTSVGTIPNLLPHSDEIAKPKSKYLEALRALFSRFARAIVFLWPRRPGIVIEARECYQPHEHQRGHARSELGDLDCGRLALKSCSEPTNFGPNPIAKVDGQPQAGSVAALKVSTRSSGPSIQGISNIPSFSATCFPKGQREIDPTELLATKDKVPNLFGLVSIKLLVCTSRYSKVYRGTYGISGVAIKVLRVVKNNRTTERKFRRELSIWWHLRHPNIAPLYGYFQHDDGLEVSYSLVSEWAEGGNAAQYIHRDLSWNQRIKLISDVARGLKYLHGFSIIIVHGDIKPQNVLIDKNGVGQLCDFGLTRLMDDGSETGLTTTTAHTGTTRYLAYELVRYKKVAIPTTATDVYAFGCLAHEFIYRLPPHAALDNHWSVSYAIYNRTPPAERPHDLTQALLILWDLFDICWDVEPRDRMTAEHISQYLEQNKQTLNRIFDYPHELQATTLRTAKTSQSCPASTSIDSARSPQVSTVPLGDSTRSKASPPLNQRYPQSNLRQRKHGTRERASTF